MRVYQTPFHIDVLFFFQNNYCIHSSISNSILYKCSLFFMEKMHVCNRKKEGTLLFHVACTYCVRVWLLPFPPWCATNVPVMLIRQQVHFFLLFFLFFFRLFFLSTQCRFPSIRYLSICLFPLFFFTLNLTVRTQR
jgi:hypothetical protein